jgi:hypothetical protein
MECSHPLNASILTAMFGWPFVVILLFTRMPARRAAMVSFLAGWMFLPDVSFHVKGFPEYSKTSATTLAVLVGTLLFDARALWTLRPSIWDLPIAAYCCSPFASSMANGLGAYDGVSGMFKESVSWGMAYVLGRAHLRSLEAFRELAVLLFLAGLVYTPFCIYEIRMSPQLNRYLYGFGDSGGGEYASELGAWGSRPRVFMRTGLALGTFMTAASIMGVWLWYTGSIRRIHGFAAGPLVAFLVVVSVFCKNMGAICLLVFGLGVLFSIRWTGKPLLVYLLILSSPLYMTVRASGRWSAESMVEMAAMVHPQRAASLDDRLRNDSMLAEKALARPLFGWGGWGRARIYREDGRDISITDGLWIILLGNSGIFGLAACTATLLVPPAMFLHRYPARWWLDPGVAGAAAAAILVVLYMIDNLFNAMFNPVYVMASAGLVTLVANRVPLSTARQPARVARHGPLGVHPT